MPQTPTSSVSLHAHENIGQPSTASGMPHPQQTQTYVKVFDTTLDETLPKTTGCTIQGIFNIIIKLNIIRPDAEIKQFLSIALKLS